MHGSEVLASHIACSIAMLEYSGHIERTSNSLKDSDSLVRLILIKIQVRGKPDGAHAELEQGNGFPGADESRSV